MIKIDINDLKDRLKGAEYRSDLVMINIRGCNGSGKSTTPMLMQEQDPFSFQITFDGKVRATVFPTFNFVAMGKYESKTGGLDGFKGNEETFDVLSRIWSLPFNILLEGVISSTIYSTYSNLFQQAEKWERPFRKIGIMNLLPPFETCLKRIALRTPGKEIKEDQVEGKWFTVQRNAEKFKNDGLNSWISDNSSISRSETLDWFLSELEKNVGKVSKNDLITEISTAVHFNPEGTKTARLSSLSPNKSGVPSGQGKSGHLEEVIENERANGTTVIDTRQPKPEIVEDEFSPPTQSPHPDRPEGDGAFLRGMTQEIMPYWEQQYLNIPNDDVVLRVDPLTGKTFWDDYWETLTERQNIWYKRVVQGLPKPWTNHKTMANFHMTNVFRDDDRVTKHFIKNYLPKLEDTYESKKFLLLNIFIFRLFVRPETTDLMGYIHSETLEEDWEKAKEAVRKIRSDGEVVFTSAYYVNDLKSANRNEETNSNKVENAICLIEFIIDHLDEIAEFTFNPENNMESCIEKFQMIPAVGAFNAYEASLDMAIVKMYTGIDFVSWDADYYINVGPGCKLGLDYIFENRGNMSYTQLIFFIMSVQKNELERLGLDFKFPGRTDRLDGRALEGWSCEYSKVANHYTFENGINFKNVSQKKRPKKKMKLMTKDVNDLL